MSKVKKPKKQTSIKTNPFDEMMKLIEEALWSEPKKRKHHCRFDQLYSENSMFPTWHCSCGREGELSPPRKHRHRYNASTPHNYGPNFKHGDGNYCRCGKRRPSC